MNESSPSADDIGEAERGGAAKDLEAPISRRTAVGGVAFFGAAMCLRLAPELSHNPSPPVVTATRRSPQNRPVVNPPNRKKTWSAQ
jgi:hypothetical protein